MSDIPNPIGSFEIFTPKKVKPFKKSKSNTLKKLSKKVAKKLFGKKFVTKTRAELREVDPSPAIQIAKPKKAAFQIIWASTPGEIKEAQRLRYKVFAEEMGANLPSNADGLDVDEFDSYCDHLLIRDQDSLKVVGTYRVLPPHKAKEIGRLYSDSEFDLSRIDHLRPKLVELGRSCVHQDYRSGAVIMALWSGLAQYMQKNDYEIMLGCASIPMADGGHFAASLYNSLGNDQMAPTEFHAFPRLPLPLDRLNGGLEVQPPPLIKGYLKLGAKICSAPAWDPDFNTADLLTMLRLSEINPRYAKHFLGM
ncbi:GNAT family N-acetyltransferase [Polynucleobacter asymbioticus]|jgi:putative hemolysin|uniref:L-ornithine N(alpha)-acyltransferase n=1 Tax=Polynucleobacter asymbioticus (strain DSM 18221 / CIP 109841 / QLW-P1DMWA-1) TaxID=312153 RepID=A4SZ88_POLAQ|nr:ornithine-acyl[acyl carrier protein] N-acyltransferase [Polynucleobacter asymbioticus QLW-P1DMWA-1]